MNLNKDYLIVVDTKSATVTTPSAMQFYITDIKTANIFAQLVINESNSELIKRYAPIENAEDFEITLRIIKPNNQFMELEFLLLNQLEAFFIVDLTDEYKDYIGEYQCELFVDCRVNDELERITTSSFTYEVLPSIANNLDDVIEGDPDYPLVEEMLVKMDEVVAAAEETIANTNSKVDEAINNKADKEHTHDQYATTTYVDESIGEVVTIIGDNPSAAISWDDIPSGSGYYKLTGTLNGGINLNDEIVYITRITGGFFKQAMLYSVGKPIANICDTAVFTDWDDAAGKYNTATISKHATEDYVDEALENKADKDHTHDELSVSNDLAVYGQASVYNNLRVSGVITQETAPTNDNDLTTKRYVDDSVANVPSMFAMEIVDGDLIVSYPDNSSSNIEFRINDNGELEANIND